MSILIKIFAFLFFLALVATVGFAWYYFYVFQPQKMAFIRDQQDIDNACLKGTDTKYQEFWDRECQGLGYRAQCRLPGETVQRLDQTLSDDKAACGVKYTEALKTVNYVFPWDKKQ